MSLESLKSWLVAVVSWICSEVYVSKVYITLPLLGKKILEMVGGHASQRCNVVSFCFTETSDFLQQNEH